MRVILITHGKVNPTGHNGISRVVYGLNKYAKQNGINSEIWSVVDGVKKETEYIRDQYVTVKCFPRIKYGINAEAEICRKIRAEKDSIDIIHFHMPWLLDKLPIAKTCRECGIPYIVTGHSAYSASQRQTWKMRIGKKYELPFLNGAAAVHAITREESSEFKKFGIKTKMFVIPNSVDDPCATGVIYKAQEELIHILFMGELRPQKNIDGLIEAVGKLPAEEKNKIKLDIVGPGANGSLEYYKQMVSACGLEQQFCFHGGVFGEDRVKLFKKADLYITPSLSEVISLSAIEAMAYGRPCILTRQSDVSYFYNLNFFEMCENYADDISRAIHTMLGKKNQWQTFSKNARLCYERNFKWESNIPKFIDAYELFSKNRSDSE